MSKVIHQVKQKRRPNLRPLPPGTYRGRVQSVRVKRDGTLVICYFDVEKIK